MSAQSQSQSSPAYDLFISYSHADREWVAGCLLPKLEGAGLKVAIDFRDFLAGAPCIVNMERAVEQSRHVLVVLTPRWVASVWSDFEAMLVGTADPAARLRKLIPILVEDCDPPARVRVLTYVDFRPGIDQNAAMASLLRSISDDHFILPESPAPQPRIDWKTELPDLLLRSGRMQTNARAALCIQAGIDVNELPLLEAAPRDFALQLVNYLDAAGDHEALKRICRILTSALKGAQAERLRAVIGALSERAGSYG